MKNLKFMNTVLVSGKTIRAVIIEAAEEISTYAEQEGEPMDGDQTEHISKVLLHYLDTLNGNLDDDEIYTSAKELGEE